MTRTLSPRAQEILAALEREPLAHRPDALPGEQPSATPPQAAEPATERGPADDLPARVGAALAQSELARRRLAALAVAVEEFAGRLGAADEDSRPEPEPPVRAVHAKAAAPAPVDSPAQAGRRRISNRAARRLAVDMATTGASRDAVGDRLRSEYGLTDPRPTLDLVFGAGTAEKDRSDLGPGAAELATVEEPAPSRKPEATALLPEQPAALEVIDLHHHLLPGIDDGPPTLDDALALARAAVAAGTTTVVATPHVSRDYPANTAASIAEQVIALQGALAEADIPLRVLPGAEVAVTHAVNVSDAELSALRLGAGPYVLVECPLTPTGAGFELILESLLDRGHRILLAHPERCRAFQRDSELLARLIARGALAQITASSLTGHFGRTVRDVAHGLVREGLAHVVASDAHSVDRRPPSLLSAVEAEGYAEQAAWLVGEVPRAILDGSRVPAVPTMHRPRPGLKRLLGRERQTL